MKRFTAFLLLAACTTDVDPAQSTRPIVGGTNVISGDEAVVMLVLGGQALCSGTLISPHTVLTAAHCVEGLTSASQIQVRFGNNGLSPTRTVAATAFFDDRRYKGSPNFLYDVAVVRLAEAVTSPAPITLNTRRLEEVISAGDFLRAVGFGITGEGEGGSGTKRQVEIPIDAVQPTYLQFGNATTNICSGDSGGPQFAMVDGLERQIGVTSFGLIGCDSTSSSVRVDKVLDFITVFTDAWDGPCAVDGVCNPSVTCPGHPDPDCDPCGPEGTCATGCSDVDYDCPPGLTDGEGCSSRADCESRACVQAVDDATVKYCASLCNAEGSCQQGQNCVEHEGMQVCVHAVTPGAQGTTCDNGDDCFSGMCQKRICASTCDLASPTCTDGRSCEELEPGKGFCVVDGGGCQIDPTARRGGAGALLVFLAGLALLSRWRARRAGSAARPPRR